MSVLSLHRNPNLDRRSPHITDVSWNTHIDSNDSINVKFDPVDNKSLVLALGSAADWSLNNLLASGVDPSFPIHTGSNVRIEGVSAIKDTVSQVDKLFTNSDSFKDSSEDLPE